MYISTPSSPEVENLLPRRGLNPGSAEPEADMPPSEPARRAIKSKSFLPYLDQKKQEVRAGKSP